MYPTLTFYSDNVQTTISQKYQGLVLDSNFDFNEQISNKINKRNRIIGIMQKLYLFLSRKILITISKYFVRPNLDYPDVTYDKPFNESFKTKMEMVQYRAAF